MVAARGENPGANSINQETDNQFEVAGVLKDLNYRSLRNNIEPVCILVVKRNDASAIQSVLKISDFFMSVPCILYQHDQERNIIDKARVE